MEQSTIIENSQIKKCKRCSLFSTEIFQTIIKLNQCFQYYRISLNISSDERGILI